MEKYKRTLNMLENRTAANEKISDNRSFRKASGGIKLQLSFSESVKPWALGRIF